MGPTIAEYQQAILHAEAWSANCLLAGFPIQSEMHAHRASALRECLALEEAFAAPGAVASSDPRTSTPPSGNQS